MYPIEGRNLSVSFSIENVCGGYLRKQSWKCFHDHLDMYLIPQEGWLLVSYLVPCSISRSILGRGG